MADGRSPGRAGEPAVGDEGHVLVQSHTGDGGGGVQHLPHTGAALGSLVADHHHVAGTDAPGVDDGDGLLLAVEHPGGTFVPQHFRGHGALLHHAAVRGQIAEQGGDAAGLGIRLLQRADETGVQIFRRFQVFPYGLTRHGRQRGIQQTGLGQFLHDGPDAAGPVQILDIGVTGRSQMAEVGSLVADAVDHAQIQLHPGLVSDGGQVQHGVGGAAQRHVHGLGVVEGGFRHNIPGPDVFLHQFHDLHAGLLGQPQPGGVHGGNGAVAPEGHADGLRQAVHGVGGVHPGAGAAGGTGVFRVIRHPGLVQLSGVIRPHRLKHMAQAGAAAILEAARQHGAAGTEDGGDIQPRSRHQQARHVLVAVGDHHKTVKLVGHDHGLRGIRDEVPGHQRILHPHMAHGDAVAHGDGRKHHRRAACGPDTGLYSLGDLVQPHVAGDDLVIGADHADEGPGKLLIGIAQRVKQAAVGRPLHAGLDLFRTHTLLLPSVSWRRCPDPCRRPRSCCGEAPRPPAPWGAWPAGPAWN